MALDTPRHIRQTSADPAPSRGRTRGTDVRDTEWPISEDFNVSIASQPDVVTARERGRALARVIGFSFVEQSFVTSAISELTRNILAYAKSGEISMRIVDNGRTRGITIVARDAG